MDLDRDYKHAVDAAAERGVTLHRFGAGWRFRGQGVDLLVADLRHFSKSDLKPCHNPRPLGEVTLWEAWR